MDTNNTPAGGQPPTPPPALMLNQVAAIATQAKTRATAAEARLRQHGDRIDIVEEVLAALTVWREQVDAVLDTITDSPARYKVIDWFVIDDPDTATKALIDLLAWSDTVFMRHHPDPFPRCWPWHPNAVAELLSLRAMHRKALASKQPDDYSHWFKLVRDTAPLIKGPLKAEKCNNQHHADRAGKYVTDWDCIPDYAAWWVTYRGNGPDGAPVPGLRRV